MPGLARLRFHDLRHHADTELAESQASDMTILSIAGHVGWKMLEHHSHIRMAAKWSAMDAISTKPTEIPNQAGSEGEHVINGV